MSFPEKPAEALDSAPGPGSRGRLTPLFLPHGGEGGVLEARRPPPVQGATAEAGRCALPLSCCRTLKKKWGAGGTANHFFRHYLINKSPLPL